MSRLLPTSLLVFAGLWCGTALEAATTPELITQIKKVDAKGQGNAEGIAGRSRVVTGRGHRL